MTRSKEQPTERDERRFWVKVALPNEQGCMLWLGSVSPKGYARFKMAGRTLQAHRLSYESAYGPIPGGMVIDHTCRVRHCVAPGHLEPVTNAENIARGEAGRHNALKTHCKRGHEFTEENTRVRVNGTRVCRTCALLLVHEHRRRKRGEL